MSNIKISYPRIALDALTVTASEALRSTQNIYDGMLAKRACFIDTAASTTAQILTFDLGSSNTLTCDHVAFARADFFNSTLTNLTLQRSSDGSSWTTEQTLYPLTLTGTQTRDTINYFTESSAYRYWRLNFSGSSNKFKFSKVSFGQAFDFGTDPSDITIDTIARSQPSQTRTGNYYFYRDNTPKKEIKATFRGVSDDKADEFFNKIYKYRDIFNIFIYTSTHHDILENKKIIHCEINEATITKAASDYNNIEIKLTEVLA